MEIKHGSILNLHSQLDQYERATQNKNELEMNIE